jgi:glycosyltransferase 2 family protein
MSRRRWRTAPDLRKVSHLSLARLAATVFVIALVVALLTLVDFDTVVMALANVSVGHVLAGLSLVQAQIVLSAMRWRFTAGRLGQKMSCASAIREYYVATAVNQLLPGGVAGDALRAFRARDGQPGDLKRSSKAVIFERLSGQLSFFAFFAIGLFAWPLLPGDLNLGGNMLVPAAALLVAVSAIYLLARRPMAGLKGDLRSVFIHRGALVIQAGLSLAVMLGYVGLFMLAADAVGAPLPSAGVLTVVPACLLAMLVPTGLGGWGTREAAAAALWPLAGLSSADGVAASLVYGALALAGAAPGLVVLLFGQNPQLAQSPPACDGAGDQERSRA